MPSVLMVCLGNICRSPMAEGLLVHKLRVRGLTEDYVVDSAGTAAYHVGSPPDPRTVAELARHGIRHPMTARQVAPQDYARFDWILAMDEANLRDLRRRAPTGSRARLELALQPVGGGEVPDPYYGGPEGFSTVYDLLDRSLDAWLDRWQEA